MPDTGILEPYLILIAIIAAVTFLEKKISIPSAILLVPVGIGLSFLPWFPKLDLDPTVALSVFLPPLVYFAGAQISWQEFTSNLRPIGLLAIGLVLFTTLLVAIVAHLLVPGMSWPVAFVLGAVVSPPDDVATVSIANKLGIPKRLVTIIEGEGLVNDATALIAFRYAVVAVTVGSFSIGGAALSFGAIAVGEFAYGAAVGWFSGWVRQQVNEPSIEITISLLTPYLAFLVPQMLHGSGVLAAVAAGLYYSWHGPMVVSSNTRLQLFPVWDMISFILNGLLFLLTGLQLRSILESFPSNVSSILIFSGIISVTVIAVRFLWLVPSTVLPRVLSRSIRTKDPMPEWRHVFVLGWTGIRGAISLAAALAIPLTIQKGVSFPQRNLIIFTTFFVILVTLVLQGATLPMIIRTLGIDKDGEKERDEELREQIETRVALTRHALRRIAELAEREKLPRSVSDELSEVYQARLEHLEAHQAGRDKRKYQRLLSLDLHLQQEILETEREFVIHLREEGKISDETLSEIEYDLDLRETRLKQGVLAEDAGLDPDAAA